LIPFLAGRSARLPGIFPVFLIRIGIPLNPAKSFPRGGQFDWAIHLLDAVPLAGIKIALHELHDGDLHPVAAGPNGDSQSSRGLSLPMPGDYNHEALLFFRNKPGYLYHKFILASYGAGVNVFKDLSRIQMISMASKNFGANLDPLNLFQVFFISKVEVFVRLCTAKIKF